MSNILWEKPDGTLATTTIFDGSDPILHGDSLKTQGNISADWVLVGIDVTWPASGWAHETYRWDGSAIVVDMAAARNEKNTEIKNQFEAAIVQPVTSAALGTPHVYSCDSESRNFLNNLITFGSGGKFACADVSGVIERRQHTSAQLLQVGADMRLAIEVQFDKYEGLLNDIGAADEQTLKAIAW